MKSLQLLLILSCCCFFWLGLGSAKAEEIPEILGNYPVCEPSAVVKVTVKEKEHLLVGDNEIEQFLWLYPLDSGEIQGDRQQELNLGKTKIEDIEAIASLEANRVLIFGSHSRNGKCEEQKKRQRFVQGRVSDNSFEIIGEVVKSSKITSQELFNGVDFDENKILKAVSNAIDNAEQKANLAKGKQASCAVSNHFNIEGAVAIPEDNSVSNVWLGLRSPLVNFEQKDFAILLHLKELAREQFDTVALIDLGGRGIRELSFFQGSIWGIAGGPEDERDNFVLWKFPAQSLRANAIIKPEILRSLPNSSEGLVFLDSTAYVLIDGDIGKSGSRCKIPGKFIKLVID
jgi:hypothetical protein